METNSSCCFLELATNLNVLAPLSDNLNDPYRDDNNGLTPMFDAASRGHAEIVEVLAPLLANPNTPLLS